MPPGGGKIRCDPVFPGTCAAENTLLSPQACALCACDAAGCIFSKKCLHFFEACRLYRHADTPGGGPMGSSGRVRLSKKPKSTQETESILQGKKALGRVLPPGGGKIRCDPFFPGTCASEKTLLSPQACALCACDTAGCIFSKKCLHFFEACRFYRHASGCRKSPAKAGLFHL